MQTCIEGRYGRRLSAPLLDTHRPPAMCLGEDAQLSPASNSHDEMSQRYRDNVSNTRGFRLKQFCPEGSDEWMLSNGTRNGVEFLIYKTQTQPA